MILVDTPIWIKHLKTGDPELEVILESDQVYMHRYIIGELACVELKPRAELLRYFNELRQAPVASHQEVMQFIEGERMMGAGVGYVDMHLLASAKLGDLKIWTHDKRLLNAGSRLDLNY